MYSASELLASTPYVDSGSDEIRAFVARNLSDAAELSPTQRAIRLFDAVRDQVRYNPFNIGTTADEYRASFIATQPTNYCVPKAIMLTAGLRAAGVPAAVGFADVRNHLNSPKLAELMETDLFIYHGYVALWLDGRQIKVTPAFNTEMCGRFGVKQLVFDGQNDALFHEFDVNSQRHMEYVNDRGWFIDPPIKQLLQDFHATYPKLWQSSIDRVQIRDANFHGER
ncbi:MAG: transglutaminase family protein [Bradyrhizobium sp.]|jgi:transglutaminase-like putative cysteine protease|uniref:transglutaminase-like domain-containing protein n=1 Tax=Bradyrhizobium TaxID=374 RepID=UPI0004050C58|nr:MULTISPECIES: transglutaminase family protein [Bradyrhizobium]MBJ7403203.1 transglutaminase family protein [Bradyrhizobium sp.]